MEYEHTHIDIHTIDCHWFVVDFENETTVTLRVQSVGLVPTRAPGQSIPSKQPVIDSEQITGATPIDVFKKACSRVERATGAKINWRRTNPSAQEVFGRQWTGPSQ